MSDDYNKKFIEYDLPLAEISEESAREKNIRHGHPSTLHIWWARRPLASSRATAFAALIDDPGEKNPEKREEIKELIKKITPWEAVKNGNSEDIKKAQKMIEEQYGEPPKVLDPFAGGGSIPLETLRLGCETYASDYNPVAVFIEKATIEWPQKFGIEVEMPIEEIEKTKKPRKVKKKGQEDLDFSGDTEKVNLLAFLVEKWANIILEEAREEIGQFYPEENADGLVGKREITHKDGWTPVGYLWARTIPCQNPNCGAEIPLIRQFWLAKKKNKKIAYRPIIDKENKKIEFEILQGKELQKAIDEGFDPKDGTVSRANATCPICGQVTKAKTVRKLAKSENMGERLIAIVLHHSDEIGKKYKLASDKDKNKFNSAEKYLNKKITKWSYIENPLPEEEIPLMSGTFNVPIYGLDKWKKLFNPRQQLGILGFLEKTRDFNVHITMNCNKILKKINENLSPDELANVVTSYLAVIINVLANQISNLVRWAPGRETIAGVFSRPALPMLWDYFSINPFSGSTGSVQGALKWILFYLRYNKTENKSNSFCRRQSATNLKLQDESLDAVFTDPPYYNNVPYSDLSDFFYVWLKKTVGDKFPDLFSTPLTPKSEEACEMAGWDSERYGHKDAQFFEDMLSKSFQEMHRVLKPGGIAVIVYAHKTTEGWETVLNALLNTGFVVTGSWPIHTEMKSRLRAAASAALSSSIYMVCRKVKNKKKIGYFNEIKPAIDEKIRKKLDQFMKEGIAGGDFFISAIGPAMEVFSKYKYVEKYSGEKVGTDELLTYIRGVAADFLCDNLLGEVHGEVLDKSAQFYLTYRWTFLDNKVEYDDARRIATAEGVNMENYYNTFINKGTKYIKVLGPHKRKNFNEIGSNPNMVDTLHKACFLWKRERKKELQIFLSSNSHARSDSFWQFAQAVAETLVNGNKEKQWLEGLLVSKDRYISEEFVKEEKTEKQEVLFEE